MNNDELKKENSKNLNTVQNESKPLPEVFKELKEARNKQFLEEKINSNKWSFKELNEYGYEYIRRYNKFKHINNSIKNVKTVKDDVKYFLKTKNPVHVISYLAVVMIIIFLFGTMYSNYIYATDVEFGTEKQIVGTFEKNENILDLDKIIEENSSIVRKKEVTTESFEIEFETIYTENPLLPEGEEVITEEGTFGIEDITYINSFENDEIVESKEIKRVITEEPVPQYVDIGTSKFLAEKNAHIGDTIYVNADTEMRFQKDDNADVGFIIPMYMDVQLKNIDGDWYTVSYENVDLIVNGYVREDTLESSYTNPELPEKARIYRILNEINIDMLLNQKSGLTEEDYIKIFTDISSDKNDIFVDNAVVFYVMEQNYNVNGLFLASIGIHESAWGTSAIAKDKKNLFGYGAYDSSPYESSYTFDNYSEGIEILAKSMAKYYLNEEGNDVGDGDISTGKYYNGSTVKGVNVRYASDVAWSERVFATMESLYSRLK